MTLKHDLDWYECRTDGCSEFSMQEVTYHFLEEEEWLGCLRKHPDFWAEGKSFTDLHTNLRKLFFDLSLVESLKDGRVIQLHPIQ
jgi:hypothetical protein